MNQSREKALEALRQLLESHDESIVMKAAELLLIYEVPTQGRA